MLLFKFISLRGDTLVEKGFCRKNCMNLKGVEASVWNGAMVVDELTQTPNAKEQHRMRQQRLVNL